MVILKLWKILVQDEYQMEYYEKMSLASSLEISLDIMIITSMNLIILNIEIESS